MIVRSAVLAGFAIAVLGAGSAFAASYTSSYSDLDLGKCDLVEEDSEFGFVQMRCDGQHGYDVYATEGDLRLYLAYRKPGEPLSEYDQTGNPIHEVLLEYVDAEGEEIPEADDVENLESASEEPDDEIDLIDPETGEWLDIFVPVGVRPIGQTISPFNNLGPKLEWRAPNRQGAEPFATIVRYVYQKMADDGTYTDGQVLVVSRFRDGESCHVAYIDALANVNANLMAREVADKLASGGDCPDGAVPVLGSGGAALRF